MQKKGFTLIELLIIIGILGVLAGFVIIDFSDPAKETARKGFRLNIEEARLRIETMERQGKNPQEIAEELAEINMPLAAKVFAAWDYSTDLGLDTPCTSQRSSRGYSVYDFLNTLDGSQRTPITSGEANIRAGTNAYDLARVKDWKNRVTCLGSGYDKTIAVQTDNGEVWWCGCANCHHANSPEVIDADFFTASGGTTLYLKCKTGNTNSLLQAKHPGYLE